MPVNLSDTADVKLTAQQSDVIYHDRGHARVMAVAGSGKTTTLVYRVIHLLSLGFEPRRVLVLMYNRSAREDFSKKLQKEYARQQLPYARPEVRTFHSIGHKLCESMVRWGELQPRTLVRDGWPYEKLVRQAIVQALPDADPARRRKALDKDHLDAFMQFAERVKADLETADEQFQRLALPDEQHYFPQAFHQLELLLGQQGLMTFSDLLYRPVMAILKNPSLEQRVSNHLDHVIVDEYQDINGIQQFLLGVLAGQRAQVMVVGDVDQCIYEWRGARPEFMLRDFVRQFQQAVSFPLSYSFRYGAALAISANYLIAHNNNRDDGLCLATPDHGETRIESLADLSELVPAVMPLLQEGAENLAVLVRSWALSMPLQLLFLQHSIPFRLHQQGHFVFNQPLIGQFLAYLELAAGSANADIAPEILSQTLNFPPLFLSQHDQAAVHSQVMQYGLQPQSVVAGLSVKPFTARRLKKRLQLLLQLQRESADQPVGALALRILQETDAYNLIDKAAATKDQAQERKQTLQALVNYIRQQPMTTARFLEHIEHQKQNGASLVQNQSAQEAVLITTVHGAKGLEWHHVVLAGLTEGSFPCYQNSSDFDRKAEESERRLFYVAMTRARKSLWLLTDHGLSDERKKRISRFVAEMQVADSCRVAKVIREPHDLPPEGLNVSNATLIRRYLSALSLGHWPVTERSGKSSGHTGVTGLNADTDTGYQVGDAVEHRIFGMGTLTHIEIGDKTRLTIHFAHEGVKVLLAEWAPIKRLG